MAMLFIEGDPEMCVLGGEGVWRFGQQLSCAFDMLTEVFVGSLPVEVDPVKHITRVDTEGMCQPLENITQGHADSTSPSDSLVWFPLFQWWTSSEEGRLTPREFH